MMSFSYKDCFGTNLDPPLQTVVQFLGGCEQGRLVCQVWGLHRHCGEEENVSEFDAIHLINFQICVHVLDLWLSQNRFMLKTH